MFLASMLLISTALAQTCPKFSCHLGGEDWKDDCYRWVTTNTTSGSTRTDFELQICESNLQPYCDIKPDSIGSVACSYRPEKNTDPVLPGEPCIRDSDCMSDKCVSNLCEGKSLGGSCVSHADCNPGLYCASSNICKATLADYMACSSTWECKNQLACNNTLYEPGLCLPYYSIKSNEPVGMCVTVLGEGKSELCESGSCQLLTKSTNGEGLCREAFTTKKGTYPHICMTDSDCVGSNGQTELTGNCECGMDKDGNAYCQAWSGDRPSLINKSMRMTHMRSHDIEECQTMARFSEYCMKKTLSVAGYQQYLMASLLSGHTARYMNNDYCVQTMINSAYYSQPTFNGKCKAYSCASVEEMKNNHCATYNQGINAIRLNECKETGTTPFCDIGKIERNEWVNITCSAAPSPGEKYPGEACTQGSECLTGTCTNKVCVGEKAGTNCTMTDECDLGLFCQLNVSASGFTQECQPLLTTDSKGCLNDYDCELNAGCDLKQTGGVCRAYFSMEIGTSVQCSTGTSLLCKTGACDTLTSMCIDAPIKLGEHPQKCSGDGECVGLAGSSVVTGSCSCGYNPFGQAYCDPFLGDSQGKEYLKQYKRVFGYSEISKLCHTARRFSSDCWSMVASAIGDKDVGSIYLGISNFTNYVDFLENESCVINVVTKDYWQWVPNPTPYDPDDNPVVGEAIYLLLGALWMVFF